MNSIQILLFSNEKDQNETSTFFFETKRKKILKHTPKQKKKK